MANKFAKVAGLKTVFAPQNATSLNTTEIKSGVTEVNSQSILYLIADANDKQYGYQPNNKYIWMNGTLFGHNAGEPIATKVYESTSQYAATSGSNATATWYFLKVRPDSQYKTWRVVFKVRSYCPNYPQYDSTTWSTYMGAGTTGHYAYANFNERENHAHYYTNLRLINTTGFNAGSSNVLGVNIIYSNNYTVAAYYRTFEVSVYSYEGCSIELLDAATLWADYEDNTAANYVGNYNSNAVDCGLQETGDSDSFAYTLGSYATYAVSAENGVFPYALSSESADDHGIMSIVTTATTATNKVANKKPFILGSRIYYYNSGTTRTSGNISAGELQYATSRIDARYSLNVTNNDTYKMTSRANIYLVGTPDEKMHSYVLDDVWWTETLPTTEDGKVYIFLGVAYPETYPYRISFEDEHPILMYKGDKIVRVYPDLNVEGVTMEDAITGVEGVADASSFATVIMQKHDEKQGITLATTTKAYVTGVSTAPTSTQQDLTGVADTNVYLTTTAGQLNATSFKVAESATMQYDSTNKCIQFIFN